MSRDSDQTPDDLAARAAALEVATAALTSRGGLDQALATPPFATLAPRERGFARMLAMTLLRRLGAIDAVLDARLQRPPPEPVRMLLRLGLAQALYLDTPAFAAVDTTVRLAGHAKATRGFKGLVNGVLRGALREPVAEDPQRLAPSWLYARWRAAYGAAAAIAIAAMIPEEPATDLTLRADEDAAALASELEAGVLPGGQLRTRRGGDVASWPGYAEGRWWVQDAAAAIPARLLDIRGGETALDLCAAPGGKALQLATAGAQVTALDRSADRLRRLSQSLERTGLAAEVVVADAAEWDDPRRFDAVLLDAPCSASGTFRRHPETLWLARAADIASLAAVQARLLDAACERTAPGGRLVYGVCSLEPEEGEAQIEALLKRQPAFTLAPVLAGQGGAPEASLTEKGWLRILPHHAPGGLDGFFAARLVRAP